MKEHENSEIKGLQLLKLMEKRAEEEKSTLEDRCFSIGVSYPMVASVGKGRRSWEDLGTGVLRKISDWLGLSLLQVYMLGEIFSPTDLAVADVSLEKRFEQVCTSMRDDVSWGAFTPAPELLRALPAEVKILMAMLYGNAVGVSMLASLDNEKRA